MDALKITLKDLTLLSRDRRALVILVAMPMVIIAIVGSSTGRLDWSIGITNSFPSGLVTFSKVQTKAIASFLLRGLG